MIYQKIRKELFTLWMTGVLMGASITLISTGYCNEIHWLERPLWLIGIVSLLLFWLSARRIKEALSSESLSAEVSQETGV